ncbi:ribonuclease HII [Spiribacter sp. C176]|uniref:Ribonuclease HII n=1 Tax=Spiribacter salilacus TaxID=2664894 RepID=A0A6N7QSC9_9GAMM|nr:ribonuclease HII [Spiribacter salilacus]MRH77217.1 ribonuclease HII [Spiribacter salilacus]
MRSHGVIESGVAGVDEAGRGPLAGPVVAAAVILAPNTADWSALRDSKRLSPKRRVALANQIREHACAWAIGEASVAEIDELNILQATLVAMRRAIFGLKTPPHHVYIDGRDVPTALNCSAEALIKGDALVPAISAASILAKVRRDEHAAALHAQYPDYGFDRHGGYPTALHLDRLSVLGPTEAHRRTFGPVRRALSALSPQ